MLFFVIMVAMNGGNPYDPRAWWNLIPDIDRVIAEMDRVPIISVGITPYTRIVPSFFLKNYSIYTIKRSTDIAVMESVAKLHVFEDRFPDLAKKVHGTGYLVGNYAFQSFLKSRRVPPLLMMSTINDKTIHDLESLGIRWMGNAPKTFESVMFKGGFRELLKRLNLPCMPTESLSREDFIATPFETHWNRFSGAFVVQRADKEVGGNEGTFFIHTGDDFNRCREAFTSDTTFKNVVVSPFISGHSVSMLGCVMPQGKTLSGPLQLQFIDVPEALNGLKPSGVFFGNDIGFHPWGEAIEQDAVKVVEGVGAHLAKEGYRGVFGIDFLYDEKRNQLFPNECNPRFTGSLTLYSLMLLEAGVPPLEFFHIMAHLNITSNFDFDTVNKALKTRIPCAHIAFSPKGIPVMKLPILAGVYHYDHLTQELAYEGPGTSLADLTSGDQFLLIDTVPSMDESIEQNVPRLFKFIFRRSIAVSSHQVDEGAAFLVERFATALKSAALQA